MLQSLKNITGLLKRGPFLFYNEFEQTDYMSQKSFSLYFFYFFFYREENRTLL